MISIIISSYNDKYFTSLSCNIKKTIGVPYEIIKIDNPGLMGLTQAYNKGASSASFSILLFIHEDIEFVTQNWGIKIIETLKKTNCGLLGIAGSTYKSKMISGWYQINSDNKEVNRFNYIQEFKYSIEETCKKLSNPLDEEISKVVALDGVFLAVNKYIWDEIKFDENLKNFHAYDLDYSLSVGEKYDNYVIYNVLIKHFSEGYTNKQWLLDTLYINKKHCIQLPKSTSYIDSALKKKIELNNYLYIIFIIKSVVKNKIDRVHLINYLQKFRTFKWDTRQIYRSLRCLLDN